MRPANFRLTRQKGTSLLVAMVALVAMMTAGMALMRSIDSANLASSNFQMQQSAEQNVDMALNEALLAFMQSHPVVGLNIMDRNTTNAGIAYWATMQPTGPEGIPTALMALPAPGWGATGPVATGWPGEQIDAQSQQLRRYFIERLCNAPGFGSLGTCQVYAVQFNDPRSSTSEATPSEYLPYIRITVRVDGPKGAVSYAQMFMKGE